MYLMKIQKMRQVAEKKYPPNNYEKHRSEYKRKEEQSMNQKSVRYSKVRPSVVFACSWCHQEDLPTLHKGQAYTHGICTKHKLKLLMRVRGVSIAY